MQTPHYISTLTEQLRELPGIGPRQARRIAEALVRKDRTWVQELVRTLSHARQEVRRCPTCERTVFGGSGPCGICSDTTREGTQLLVVEKDVDLEAIERSDAYRGHYFVLGGHLSPLTNDQAFALRTGKLLGAVELRLAQSPSSALELILALSATADGEDTALVIREKLEAVPALQKNVRVSELGRGLSTGSELEYADTRTVRSAILRRVSDVSNPS